MNVFRLPQALKIIFVISLFSLSAYALMGQAGCTDSLAVNYNAQAIINNGSCIYPKAALELNNKIILPNILNETSGLVSFEGEIWTLNDSGNLPEIYQIDSETGDILRTVYIKNAENTDWEAITADENFIYIGDFGNNATGIRKDLKIYRIQHAAIRNIARDSLEAAIINFYYEGQQTEKEVASVNATKYDCEAFIVYGDSIHLFTKDWVDYKTGHYILPAIPGEYKAKFVAEYNVNGLVTDAAISNTGAVVLAGYTGNFRKVFFQIFTNYPGNNFFAGNSRYLEGGNTINLFNNKESRGQLEAICFTNNLSGLVSSEIIDRKIAGVGIHIPPQLMHFNLSQYINLPINVTAFTTLLTDSARLLNIKVHGINKAQKIIIQKTFNGRKYIDIGSLQPSAEELIYTDKYFALPCTYRVKIITLEGNSIYFDMDTRQLEE